MIDISRTTEPKSDQLNADDLISGPRTLKITGVKVVPGDQPVNVEYEGGDGKPWKPCKSMRRALIVAWGSNGEDYIGRSLTVYNDTSVKWASSAVGGIRISHMSHIKEKIRMMLTVTRGKKAPFTVEVLNTFAGNVLSDEHREGWKQELERAETMAQLQETGGKIANNQYNEEGTAAIREHYQAAVERIRSSKVQTNGA